MELYPPAVTDLVGLEQEPQCSVAASKFPKSEASPVDAIVIKSITSLILRFGRTITTTEYTTSLITRSTKIFTSIVKSPKSVAFDVVAIVAKSIVLVTLLDGCFLHQQKYLLSMNQWMQVCLYQQLNFQSLLYFH